MSSLGKYKTVVRNTSGGTRFFGYLPKFGAKLAAGADFVYTGDLMAWIGNKTRYADQFEKDLHAGNLTIIQLPASVVFDATATRVRVLGVNSGTVTVGDPADGSYIGPAPTV